MSRIVSFFGDESPVFVRLNERAKAYAAERGLEYRWSPQKPYDRAAVIEALRAADYGIIDIEPYGEEIFSKIEGQTRLLVRFGVGYDKVDLAAASRHGIAIARTTGANTLGVAEMALSLILACRRKLRVNQRYVAEGDWVKDVARETVGSTVGILGFGAIGQALAKLLSGFDARLIAYDPRPDVDRMRALGVELLELDALFEQADALSVHTPYTPETRHIVDARRLARMKRDAVIVNTARGGLIDEAALYDALKSGRPAAAGLDVFATEPLPLDSPLLKLENIVLTPHVSSQTYESLWRIYAMAIDIAADFDRGLASPHILNPDYARP